MQTGGVNHGTWPTHIDIYTITIYILILIHHIHKVDELICEFAMGTIFKVFFKDFDNVNMHNMLEWHLNLSEYKEPVETSEYIHKFW